MKMSEKEFLGFNRVVGCMLLTTNAMNNRLLDLSTAVVDLRGCGGYTEMHTNSHFTIHQVEELRQALDDWLKLAKSRK